MNANLAYLEDFEAEVDRCQFWIEEALAHSARSHLFIDVKEMILSGFAQLWSNEHGCAVTCFSHFPESKMLQVWLLGGDFEKVYAEHNAKMESFAKENGCDQIFVNGRKGWERKLQDRGYKHAAVILTKEI